MSATLNFSTDVYKNKDLSNTPILVFGGPTNIKGWVINNPNAGTIFTNIYNEKAIVDVSIGITVPDLHIRVPGVSQVVLLDKDYNFPLNTGFVIAAVNHLNDTEMGTSAPSSNISVRILYK